MSISALCLFWFVFDFIITLYPARHCFFLLWIRKLPYVSSAYCLLGYVRLCFLSVFVLCLLLLYFCLNVDSASVLCVCLAIVQAVALFRGFDLVICFFVSCFCSLFLLLFLQRYTSPPPPAPIMFFWEKYEKEEQKKAKKTKEKDEIVKIKEQWRRKNKGKKSASGVKGIVQRKLT